MEKRISVSVVVGILLILVGLLALVATLGGGILGWGIWLPWRLWPLVVILVGMLFVLPPILTRGKPGLGALFIPGVPILTTGALLLAASTLNWWSLWTWLWPLEVLSVALGFMLAALYTRAIGLIVPAIIIGANGLLLQFCAVTGWWGIWAVLWTIEPLAVGLALLALWLKTRSRGLFWAGTILCAIAGFFTLMMAAFMNWWLMGIFGPAVLILLGGLLLLRGLVRGTSSPSPAA